MNCPICSDTRIDFFLAKNGFNLYRCRNCGLIFVYPLVKNLEDIYGKDYFLGTSSEKIGYVDYEQDKEAMRNIFKKYLRETEKIYPQKGKLFDVGAATGYFLKIAQEQGWQVSGLDISKYASTKARQEGLKVATGQLKDMDLLFDYFDVITLWDVIEHLNDPQYNLEIISKILKKGGLIIINTSDSGSFFSRLMGKHWHHLIPPEHLFLFSLKSISILLKRSGFKILLVKKIGKNFSLQYIFQVLSRWQNFFVWSWLAQYFKNRKIGKLSLPLNLRDNFFLIAKKL